MVGVTFSEIAASTQSSRFEQTLSLLLATVHQSHNDWTSHYAKATTSVEWWECTGDLSNTIPDLCAAKFILEDNRICVEISASDAVLAFIVTATAALVFINTLLRLIEGQHSFARM